MKEDKTYTTQPPKENQENIFTGKWRIVALYANVAGQGWTLFKEYEPGEFIWKFTENIRLTFPAGSVAYSGRLLEQIKNEEEFLTEFSYYVEDRQLYIDRSDYADDGYMLACIEEHYRIEFLNDRHILLYDLEDVEVEPDDYTIMLELEKV